MPAARVFIDTNLLFYIRDVRDQERSDAAIRWLRALAPTEQGRTNLQVLNELTNALLRQRRDLSANAVFALVDEVAFLGTEPIGPQIVELAREMRVRYLYSWWDTLLLASALELGCTHFLSEDMQNGQVIADGTSRALTIVDPFAHSPQQILLPR